MMPAETPELEAGTTNTLLTERHVLHDRGARLQAARTMTVTSTACVPCRPATSMAWQLSR